MVEDKSSFNKLEESINKLKEQARAAGKITSQFEKLNKQTKVFDDVAEFSAIIKPDCSAIST